MEEKTHCKGGAAAAEGASASQVTEQVEYEAESDH
jgi:hypothetical protein